MIIVLSPAKSLNLEEISQERHSLPEMQTEANKLSKIMKKMNADDLKKLMGVSDQLAVENVKRYKSFKVRSTLKNAKRAINMFNGDVYRGLSSHDFEDGDYDFAQEHIRILSGLYGLLKPMDLIQPYRLEMGSRIETEHGKSLYAFWNNKITNKLNQSLKKSNSETLVNLASDEYFKSIKQDKLKADVLHIKFKELRDGKLKFLSYNAKVARGLMTRYIIKNRITNPEEMKGFDYEGYGFSEENSSDNLWMFIR